MILDFAKDPNSYIKDFHSLKIQRKQFEFDAEILAESKDFKKAEETQSRADELYEEIKLHETVFAACINNSKMAKSAISFYKKNKKYGELQRWHDLLEKSQH